MSLWRTVTTVLSAFIGIRRGDAHAKAQTQLKPVQIIITAVVLVLLLIIGLVFLVKSITAGLQ